MKNSYRRNNIDAREAPLVAAFLAILFVAGFVFFIDRVSGGVVRGYAREGGSTLWALAGSATAVLDSGTFTSKRALAKENAELRAALLERDEFIARFDAVGEENVALRAMANLAATEDGVTAPVLSSLNSSPYGTFVIGAGAADGVMEGAVVLTPGGFVLGSVTNVSSRTALVEALFAPGNEVELIADGVAFLAKGRGGRNARAEVARDARIGLHATVIVPAYEGRPAGVVGAVESAPSSAATTLFIHVPVNTTALRYVYVVAR